MEEVETANAGRDSTPVSAQTMMRPVLAALARIRTGAKAQLIAQRLNMILAAALALALVMGVLDFFLHFPLALRIGHLAVGLIAAGWLAYRRLRPALAFSPSLTDIALRIERTNTARDAGLTNLLATGVEFARAAETASEGQGGSLENSLYRRVSAQAASKYAAFAKASHIFDRRPLALSCGALLLAAGPLLALQAFVPAYVRIGYQRTLSPWSDAQWPKRTQVMHGDSPKAFAAGVALPLHALVTRTDQPEGKTPVTLYYRLRAEGTTGETRKALMTSQAKLAAATTASGEVVHGELFERLLDPDSLMVATAAKDARGGAGGRVASLEYWFETRDDQTAVNEILIVTPPAVIAAKATVTPPDYVKPLLAALASGPINAGTSAVAARSTLSSDWVIGERDVSPFGSSRGVLGPVLADSLVQITLSLSKPIAGPGLDANDETRSAFLVAAFPGLETMPFASLAADGPSWRITFRADKSLRLPVMLRDEYGITAADDTAFKIEVAQDRPPTAAVIEPNQDEAVLPTALFQVSGEGRDDVAVESVLLRQQLMRPPPDSAGSAPQPLGEETTLAAWSAEVSSAASTSAAAGMVLNLEELKLQPGDEVDLTTHVLDVLLASGNKTSVVSAKRRLRIITEAELIEQVRAELAGLREAAKRAEQEQSRLSARADDAARDEQAAAQLSPKQQSLGERLAPMKDAVARLAKRAERNQLKDDALTGVLKDAAEITRSATESSGKASDALDRLSQPKADRDSDPATKQAAGQLKAAQKQVEDDLAELALSLIHI